MAPVLTSLTALPLDLPAFPSQEALGHGKGAGTFSYTSQPLPAGAKDPGIIRFAHVVEQTIATARPKALESLAPGFAKDPGVRPIIEVQLKTRRSSVLQLWQAGHPWPLYANNGRTQSRLVSAGRKS